MKNVVLSPEEIGIRIKLARKKKGLAQNEFADAIGKSVRTVQKYESGEINMPLDVLNNIANELDISMDELISEESPGIQIDTFADIFSAIFELEGAQGIKLNIEEFQIEDNRKVLAMYCDAMECDFEYNKTFCDFLKEFRFYKEGRANGSIPDDIYKAWVKKTLIAADELAVRSKVHL